MASNKNLGAIRKEPSMRKTVRLQKEHSAVNGIVIPSCSSDREILKLIENSQNNKNYTMPKLNSVLKLREEIENIESLQIHPIKNTDNLTPRSKQVVYPKLNQRLNFESGRSVYRNLVPIDMNDLALPKKTSSISKRNSTKPSVKLPAPDLSDYLDPLPPPVLVLPEPEIKLEFPEYECDPLAEYEDFIKYP